MKEIFNNIIASLDTQSTGYSARKLSALATMVMVIILHIKWFRSDRWEYIGEVLGLDLFFILCLLGLATWQSVKEKSMEAEGGATNEPKP